MTILYCNQLLSFQFFNGEYFKGWLRNRYKLHAGLKVDFEVFSCILCTLQGTKICCVIFSFLCGLCHFCASSCVLILCFIVCSVLFLWFIVCSFFVCFILSSVLFSVLYCVFCVSISNCAREYFSSASLSRFFLLASLKSICQCPPFESPPKLDFSITENICRVAKCQFFTQIISVRLNLPQEKARR